MKTRHILPLIAAAATASAASAVPPASAPVARTFVAIGDQARIEVLRQGAGAPIVLLPSLGRGAADFDDLATRLAAAGYLVLRPEPRGIGGSTAAFTGVTLGDLADDVARVIEAEKAGPAVVVGHAFGNRVARALAARHPEDVRATVLLAAGGKVEADPTLHAAIRRAFDTSLPEPERLAAIRAAFFAPGHDPAAWKGGWHFPTALMQNKARISQPVDDWWAGGRAPMLAIRPLQDNAVPPENYALLREAVGDRLTVVEIDGAGHALLPEQPEAVAEAIIGYVKRLPR